MCVCVCVRACVCARVCVCLWPFLVLLVASSRYSHTHSTPPAGDGGGGSVTGEECIFGSGIYMYICTCYFDDDDCLDCCSRRNDVVIAFGTFVCFLT